MLDTKDKRILSELDFNARKSDAEIGRAVGLSKQNVHYRISRLLQEGIITGFYPVIDNGVRGYYYCRLFLSFQNITSETEKEIHDYVLNSKCLTWAMSTEGKYDFLISMWAKDLTQFRTEVHKLLFKFGLYIKEKKESVGLDVTHLSIKFLEDTPIKEVHIKSASGQVKLDKKDVTILEVLSENARTPTVAIASKVGLSPNAVKYRIANMMKSGVLKAFRLNIDHTKICLLYFKVLLYLKELTEEDYTELKNYLKQSGVSYTVEEIGIADLDFEIMLGSYEELFEFMDTLRNKFSRLVSDYEILLIKKTLKIGYLPP